MAGPVPIQQGPFGVAATAARRRPTAPRRAPEPIAGSQASHTDAHPFPDPGAPPLPHKDSPPSGAWAPDTPAQTLFDASRLAASHPAPAAPPTPPREGWTPPPSTLRLRDRSV